MTAMKLNWGKVGEKIYEVLENAPDTVDPLLSVFEEFVEETTEEDYAMFCREIRRRIITAFK